MMRGSSFNFWVNYHFKLNADGVRPREPSLVDWRPLPYSRSSGLSVLVTLAGMPGTRTLH